MKKLTIVMLCLSQVGCGTFSVKVQILPQATTTKQATAISQPASSTTPVPTTSTSTPTATMTPTPTKAVAEDIILTTIQMSDTRHGWGVESAGRLIRTSDGGGIWVDAGPQDERFGSHSLFAYNNETVWAAPAQLETSNVIWRTQDGGVNWDASQPIPLENGKYSPVSLQFSDTRHGWLLILARNDSGQDQQLLLYKSDDSGENWTPLDNLNQSALQTYLPTTVTNMAFFDAQTGWLGGWWGKDDPTQWLTVKTSDGGAHWGTDALRLPAQKALRCNGRPLTELLPGSLAVELVCTSEKDSKYLYHRLYYLSTQGEPDWKSWAVTGKPLSVYFLNAKQGWMLIANDQQNQILVTRDGGGSWSAASAVNWKQALFDFVDENTGWAIMGNGFSSALARTENGGKVWVQVRPVLAHQP